MLKFSRPLNNKIEQLLSLLGPVENNTLVLACGSLPFVGSKLGLFPEVTKVKDELFSLTGLFWEQPN